MPRQEPFSISGDNIPKRNYLVTYADDPPARAEAVVFFGESLFPEITVPKEIHHMSLADAQAYLDSQELPLRWNMLTVSDSPVSDSDLMRLQYIPELTRLHLFADNIADAGVANLRFLTGLAGLVVYSPLVTDGGLQHIAALSTLQSLDMQKSPNISATAFTKCTERLPDLRDVYPPFQN